MNRAKKEEECKRKRETNGAGEQKKRLYKEEEHYNSIQLPTKQGYVRPRYTESQIAQYFDRIRLSRPQRIFSVTSLTPAEKLTYLTLLKKHHLVAIPYENIQAHYSWHKGVSVSPTRLFSKIVDHHRGGWCFELNQFLNTVLLSLGFEAILAASRVFEPSNNRYGGLTHCVNIVNISGVQYLLDVGFGGLGPPHPIPLPEEAENVEAIAPPSYHHLGPRAQMRVKREVIPQQISQSRRLWVYEFRADPHQEWKPMCCFNDDFELLPEDIAILNTQGMSRTCFVSRELLIQRFTTSSEQLDATGLKNIHETIDRELDGSLVLYENRLKWRKGGDLKLNIELKDEVERVGALKHFFGIDLDEEECESIVGTVGELRESWFGAAFNQEKV
ncbi:arylamine N-acetyltransferase 2 [Periconia macrospinosa]|uniref:Arylamine N-acetyltransferase 2 n=1 Tax=Periconia macrospinosa TaxID=97972 RepID=A0A2V1ECH0_9PLEO|nr:arylamine N-acetyltransferase 2 [Periconia macrospinosa]